MGMFLLMPQEADATFEFLDGKLRVKGRFEQYMVFLTNLPEGLIFSIGIEESPAVNQSIFTLEGLYTLVDNGDVAGQFSELPEVLLRVCT